MKEGDQASSVATRIGREKTSPKVIRNAFTSRLPRLRHPSVSVEQRPSNRRRRAHEAEVKSWQELFVEARTEAEPKRPSY